MCKSVYQFALATTITVADLAVFIHCLPIICQAWGTNHTVMASLSVAMFVWVESLANLWRAARRTLKAEMPTGSRSFAFEQFSAAPRGGDCDV